ncbi:MAG: tetratricopeptide repeat protein, partial [Limnobacter sp.]|nr:tetratricopeptide repeat protein [Limnobacter sp.]
MRKARQYEQAEAVYNSLLNRSPGGEVWYGLGRTAIDQGNLAVAAPRLEKAIAADPVMVKAYADLGFDVNDIR